MAVALALANINALLLCYRTLALMSYAAISTRLVTVSD